MKISRKITTGSKQQSFSKKILVIIILMIFVTTALIDTISIFQIRNNIITQKSSEAASITKLVTAQIDTENLKNWPKRSKKPSITVY